MKRILLPLFVTLIALNSQAATVTFNRLYSGISRNNGPSTLQITTSPANPTHLAASNVKFTSAVPDAPAFDTKANNLLGQLTFSIGGLNYSYNGSISARNTSGSTIQAFYFYKTTVLGGSVGAFQLLIFYSSFQEKSHYLLI